MDPLFQMYFAAHSRDCIPIFIENPAHQILDEQTSECIAKSFFQKLTTSTETRLRGIVQEFVSNPTLNLIIGDFYEHSLCFPCSPEGI
jgi:hypothetical protein